MRLFFSADINFADYSKPWIAKQLASLCESDKLVRFERGIYYIPVNTPFGKSVLNPNKVIERKYIMDKGLLRHSVPERISVLSSDLFD